MKLLLLIFLLLIYGSECFGHGTIMRGFTGGVFENNCTSVGMPATVLWEIRDGKNVNEARREAAVTCASCTEALSTCDHSAAAPRSISESRQVTPATAAKPTSGEDFHFLTGFIQAIQFAATARSVAIGIAAVLLVWLVSGIVSTGPLHLLRWRMALASWMLLPPLAPVLASELFDINYGISRLDLVFGLCLWTDVFAALVIGIGIRTILLGRFNSVPLLSLPLVTLLLTGFCYIGAQAVITYGTFPKPLDCNDSPSSPFSVCGYFQYEGVYSLTAVLIIVIVFGALLSPNSNLIRANDSIGRWFGFRQEAAQIAHNFKQIKEPRLGSARPMHNADTQRDAIKTAIRTKREEFEL
jgi:hypothetical protein